jgi:iron complex outermembrane receptor protein
MSTGFKSYGYSRAILMGSASLLALVAYSTANAQQATTPAPGSTTPAPGAQPGSAQNSSDQLTEVIITGFRASLQTALDNKRNSDLPIESVAPEDIGKMPDQDVAESLQRLPGIQIDRAPTGEGTAVLIDGLRQNLTTLNGDVFLTGREFYVSGEGSGGGAGGNSQYNSLEGIPSEEIGGIDVYKNPKASMTEGGLGGTIDLKTRDPLAQPDGLSLGGNFRESYAQRQDDWTPNGTLVGSYKFSDALAFTASVSYDDEKTLDEEFQDQNRNQWLITDSATGPYTGALTPAGLGVTPGGSIVAPATKNAKGCSAAAPCGVGGQYYIEPQLAYFTNDNDERKTYGASFGVAAKITDSITSTVNYFFSREQETSFSYTDKVWFNGQGVSPGFLLPGIDPTQPYSIDGNGVVQNGVFNANGAETATLYQQDTDEAHNIQWRTKFNDGGPLRGDIDLSYANATSNLQADQADVEHGLYTTSAGVPTSPAAPGCNNGASTCASGPGSHGYEFAWNNGGTSGLPSVNYLAPYADVLNNPAYTTFKSNWAWANLTSQHQFAIKLDAQYDPSFVQGIASTISGGIDYAGRDISQIFGRYLINGTLADGEIAGNANGPNPSNPGAAFGPYLYYQDPGYGTPNIPYSTALSNPGLAMNVNNFGAGNIIVKNPYSGGMTNPSTYLESVWAGAGVPNNTEKFFEDGLSSFGVEERTTAVYLMEDIGAPINHFHANFGVRVVETNLTINNGQSAESPTYFGTASWNGVDSNVVPRVTRRTYTDVLPTFNFVLDVTDNQKVRFGAARVVSPQDLFLLGLGNSYNFTRQTTGRINIHNGTTDGFAFDGGTAGNTQLDPYRASQFNISWEDYFAPGGLVSVGTFYKQVDNFVEIESIPTLVQDDFGGTTADVNTPVNAGNGRIYGFEIGAQYAFNYDLVPWLKGFGFATNYTHSVSQSNAAPTSFTTTAGIPGVAKDAYTATLYYERSGFSARASYSWRGSAINDSLVGATFSFPDQNGVNHTYQVFEAAYGELDAQIGYDLNSHFGVLASVQNATDSAQHTYLQWPNLPFTYDDAGRRFYIGFKFKL